MCTSPASRVVPQCVLVVEDGVVHGVGAYQGDHEPLVVQAHDDLDVLRQAKREAKQGLRPVPENRA